MKSFRYLVIILCVLMCCEIYAQGKAEKGPGKYGELWNEMTDDHRIAYLLGLMQGIVDGHWEVLWLWRKGYVTVNKGYDKQFDFFLDKSLARNVPDIKVVRDLMTKFYADPSNTYLSMSSVFLVSVAKLRGASPELIEKMLASGREGMYRGGKYCFELRELFYEEFLKPSALDLLLMK